MGLSCSACLFVHPPVPNKKCSGRVGDNYLIQKRLGALLKKKKKTGRELLFFLSRGVAPRAKREYNNV